MTDSSLRPGNHPLVTTPGGSLQPIPLAELLTWPNRRNPTAAIEYALNKPWRPLPSVRITVSETTALALLLTAGVGRKLNRFGGMGGDGMAVRFDVDVQRSSGRRRLVRTSSPGISSLAVLLAFTIAMLCELLCGRD